MEAIRKHHQLLHTYHWGVSLSRERPTKRLVCAQGANACPGAVLLPLGRPLPASLFRGVKRRGFTPVCGFGLGGALASTGVIRIPYRQPANAIPPSPTGGAVWHPARCFPSWGG